jgi:CDGSH-type Zn-finger protein
MNGRVISRREREEATAKYLAEPHPPVELDRVQYLVCRCAEFDCKPHQAHFHEMKKFLADAAAAKKPVATEVPATPAERKLG